MMYKKILSVIFCLILFIGFIGIVISSVESIINKSEKVAEAEQLDISHDEHAEKTTKSSEFVDKIISYRDSITKKSNEIFPKNLYIELYGVTELLLGKKYSSDANPSYDIVKLNNGSLAFKYPEPENLENEINNITKLNNQLKQRQIDMLYIQVPLKIDSKNSGMPLGTEDHTNETMDEFLGSISQNGVNIFDLRNEIANDGLNHTSLFFSTDHHWKTESAFWAFGKISEKLNKDFNFKINKDLYDLNNFNIEVLPDCFLGSEGKRSGAVYSGLDDLSFITPKFDTSFNLTIPSDSIEKIGTFEKVMFEKQYVTDIDLYNSPVYSVYLGGGAPLTIIKNNQLNERKMLLVKDSFSCALAPFLALTSSQIDMIDLRSYDEKGLLEYIDETNPDIVMFIYNPSMYYYSNKDAVFNFGLD